MAKKKNQHRSPRVTIDIAPADWEKAVRANSAACLISDAGKRQHPELTGWTTDMATIRATDRAKGERYTWLTPQSAQDLLLAFDQGWSQPVEHRVRLSGAVKITKVRAPSRESVAQRRERLAELEAREAAGEALTAGERQSLAQYRRTPERPASPGPSTVERDGNSTVIVGGDPMRTGKHPNLLAGRTRAYGARRAKPAQVFHDAVELELARRLEALADLTPAELEALARGA